ncbi:hypothetical protein N0V84_004982 [Fusarium piperis]|uniref:Glycosyl hydrolase family 95 N-terminal domain-containing protein n=1 Tax=Fusarium piperis TaxID=1435070 RepID=A0A9W9BPY1_9HYPO|nr:hypothetical protein N0V84_004982 [Fusarium piperis]
MSINGDSSSSQHLRLHYSAPATEWSEALPIGNGRLGAVVYGRTDVELMQLNEDSVWYGGPQDRTPPDSYRMLPRLRQLIRDERHAEAEALVKEAFFATPASMRHYEPMGVATLEFNHTNVVDYHRCLDLETSQVSVQYTADNISYRRDVIASYPDNALLVRFNTSKQTRFIVRLDRLSDIEIETNVYADTVTSVGSHIIVHATPGGQASNKLCSVLGIACEDGGTVEAIGNCLIVNSASCTIAIAAQTTFRCDDPEKIATVQVDEALAQSWERLVERHRADYVQLFGRMSLHRWMPATLWPLGGLWLSITLIESLKSQYDETLHARLFKVHEGAVQFVIDFLIPSKCGSYLVINPSLSPENTFVSNSGSKGIFCEGSSIDMALVRVALLQFLWSLQRLSKPNHPLKIPVETTLAKIPPLTLGKGGLIQEWGLNDYEEDEPGHRHVSHLFGLYPAELIHPSVLCSR